MKVIVNNLAIEYEDEGSGPTLLFLHGWQDDLHTFDLITTRLSRSFRIVRVDLPGFGKSDLPKETWAISNYVNFVESFIKKLNLSIYTIVGHSFGGRIILKGVGENILETERNILLASAGIIKSTSLKNKCLQICSKIIKPLLFIPPFSFWREKIRTRFYTKIGSDYMKTGNLKDTFIQIIGEDLEDYAKKINNKTLLIYGEKDESTPVSDGERLQKNIKNSELYIIKDAGHFVHQEKLEKVVELMGNFLDQ